MYLRTLVVFCLLSFSAVAQKEGNIWYFGSRAGLDFNTSPPTVLTNSVMTTTEGCASIANRNGSLLFYTDGTTIWNKTHATMTNGTGLTGNSTSTQSGIVVQNPDSGHVYYVFTTYTTLAYSRVDTTLSGGLGAVTLKNVNLLSPGTEKLTAVRHANGHDVWVVSHRGSTSNSFYVFLVTGTGVNTTPVVSNIGMTVSGTSLGVIKLAPDGRTMVCMDYSLSTNPVQLLDFDNTNGTVSNVRNLISSGTAGYYGAEFSPAGRYLYVGNFNTGEINQFDVLAGSTSAIISSRKILASSATTGGMPGTFQLASDGRIYIAQYSQQYLSVIVFPEKADTFCRFIRNGISVSPRTSQIGLPTFNQSFFAQTNVEASRTCYTDSTRLTLTDTTGLDSVVWVFGDSASSEKISRARSPKHVYSQPGTYTGQIYVYRHVQPYSDTADFEVVIKPPPDISLGADLTICKGSSVFFSVSNSSANPVTSVAWSHGLGTGMSKTVSPDSTTTYTVIGDAGCMFIKDTDQVTVYVRPPVSQSLRPDTIICRGNSVVITPSATGGDSSYTFTWDNGLGTGSSKTVSPSVNTTYRVIADDGCTQKKDTDYVTVYVRPALDVILRSDTTICQGNSVSLAPLISGGDSSYTITWDNGLGTGTSKTVSPSTTTTYRVILSDGCTPRNDTDEVTIYVRSPLDVSLRGDTTICRGHMVSLLAKTSGGDSSYTITWNNGLGTGTSKTVTPSTTTTYQVILSDGCTPRNDTAYTTIYVRPALEITLPADTTICKGNGLTLAPLISGGDSSYTITWDNSLGTGTSKNISPIVTTTYRVILSDGCTLKNDTDEVTIYVRPPLDITLRSDTTICKGNSVSLSPLISGGDSSYTVTWDNGLGTGTSKTVSPATTTTYKVILSDGCTPQNDTDEVTIYVRPALDISLGPDTTICRGFVMLLAPVWGGGDSSYTLTWDNGLGTGPWKTVSPASTTTYSVILDDGCTPVKDTDYVTVYVRPALDISLPPDTAICQGNPVTLEPVFGGGDSSYTITWDNGLGTGTSKTVSPTSTTTYRVILEDGCTIRKDTAYITVYVRPPLDISLRPDTTICRGNAVQLTPVTAGGDSTYTLTWNNGLGTGTSKTVSPLTTTTYQVIISDGCTPQNDTDEVTVYVRPALDITLRSDTTICQGNSVLLSPVYGGGDSTYTLSWNNGLGTGTSKTVSPATTTTYQVILSDGCTPENDTAQVTVFVRPALQHQISADTVICYNTTAQLDFTPVGGDSSYTITWDNGLSSLYSHTVQPLDTTTYQVILSDGCTVKNDTAYVTVFVRAPLSLRISNDTSICLGEKTLLRAYGSGGVPSAYTFTWDNGLGTGDSIPIDPPVTTAYRAILSDGCTPANDTQLMHVYVKEPLKVINSPDTTICKGTSATMRTKGFGGQASTYEFIWDHSLGNGTAKTVTPDTTTRYRIILRDLCTFLDDTGYITVHVRPALDVKPSDTMICQGASYTAAPLLLGGDSTYTLDWDNGLGNGLSQVLSPMSTTLYQVILSDGCTVKNDTASFRVYVRTSVDVSLRSDTVICSGNSVNLVPAGTGGDSSYTFTWDNGLGTGPSKTVSPVVTTSYRVIMDDGCTVKKDTAFVTVFVRPALDVILRSDTTICKGNSVSLDALGTGGDSSYAFTWDNGLGTGISKTVSPSATTTYRVILDDGCTVKKDTAFVTVFVRPALDVILRSDTTICQGNSLDLAPVAAGGDSSYTFTWDNGLGTGTSKNISPISSTTYRVIISDGCTVKNDTGYVSVFVRPALDVALRSDTTICVGNNVSLQPLAKGGDSTYTFTWDNGLGTGISKVVSPSVTTSYRVIVEDGCTVKNDSAYVTVFVRPALDVTLRSDTTICIGNSVNLQPVAEGGDSSYTLTWDNGLGTGVSKVVSPSVTASYRVIVEDGCTVKNDSDYVTVFVRPPLNVIFIKDSTICTGQSIEIAPVTAGGDSSYTITWDNGLGTGDKKTVSPVVNTIYRAILSDGCTQKQDTDYMMVTVRPPLEVTAQYDTVICYGETVDITAIGQGGRQSTRVYDWDNGLGQGAVKNITPVDTTTYRVILSDGCTPKTDTAFVTVGIRPALELKANNDTLICEGKPVNLEALGKYGKPGQHVFTWDNGLGTGSAKTVNPLVTTTYTVTLSDNCSPDVQETVVVNVENLPDVRFFVSDSFICEKEQVSFDNLTTGPALSYQYGWRFGNGKESLLDEPAHIYPTQGEYTVTLIAVSPLGCVDSLVKTGYVMVNPNPVAAFKPNPPEADIEYPSVTMINQSSGADHYLWNLGDMTTSTDVSPQHTYSDTGWYQVLLIAGTNEGCYDTTSDKFRYRVKEIFRFYIPESFSPNGDGINDEFRYNGRGYVSVDMKVYNRWGELMYATDKLNEYWNGGINNTSSVLPEGVYTYIFTVRDFKRGVHHYKGTVTLIK